MPEWAGGPRAWRSDHEDAGRWRQVLLDSLPWTEYALYFTFLEATGRFERYHTLGTAQPVRRLHLAARQLRQLGPNSPRPYRQPPFIVVQSIAKIPPELILERIEPLLRGRASNSSPRESVPNGGVRCRSCSRSSSPPLAAARIRGWRSMPCAISAGADAERWTDLFLNYHAEYRAGSLRRIRSSRIFRTTCCTSPRTAGAGRLPRLAAGTATTVDALRRGAWTEAVHSAGVLSPLLQRPLHAAAHGAERIRGDRPSGRRVEHLPSRTASCSTSSTGIRAAIRGSKRRGATIGSPELIEQGAELAHESYQPVIDHFDLAAAVKDPLAGHGPGVQGPHRALPGGGGRRLCPRPGAGHCRSGRRAAARSKSRFKASSSALLTPGRWIARPDARSARAAGRRGDPRRSAADRQGGAEPARRRPGRAAVLCRGSAQDSADRTRRPACRTGGHASMAKGRPRDRNPNRFITAPVIDNRHGCRESTATRSIGDRPLKSGLNCNLRPDRWPVARSRPRRCARRSQSCCSWRR